MARIFEFVFVAFLLYFAYRRIATPIMRGYNERDREWREERIARSMRQRPPQPPKLDRTHAKDANFKDIS